MTSRREFIGSSLSTLALASAPEGKSEVLEEFEYGDGISAVGFDSEALLAVT